MKRQQQQVHGHEEQQQHQQHQPDPAPIGGGGGGVGEASPRRMTERLNMLMTFPMAKCLANLHARQNAAPSSHDDAGRGGGRLVEAVVAKMVLIVLGDFHGVDGRIYPSIETIADLASTSERTAMRAVQTLELLGIVKVTHRNRSKGSRLIDRTNWYVLDWDAIEELARSAGAEAREERRKHKEIKRAQRNMGDGSGDGTGSGVSKRPTVTCSGDQQEQSAGDPRSHDQTTEQVTNGHLGKCPTVTCASDPRSREQVTNGHLNHTTEPLIGLTAHNNRPPHPHDERLEPSRVKAGPSRAEKAPKAGAGCAVVVEVETPIATLHRLHKREKAQTKLLDIGIRRAALGALLDHAEQEDPKGEGNPLPRVMAVIEACDRAGKRGKGVRSPIAWVTSAIEEHWDLESLPGESQRRKAGAA